MEGIFRQNGDINIKDNNINTEKIVQLEDVLNSNDVELIAKYAKENRSIVAIDKVRELLELARRKGEEIVQNFQKSFKECETEKNKYLDFEKTISGKIAMSALENMPEPYKSLASKKLEDYKKELKYNAELLNKNIDNPEKIWREIFGFDYYNIPEFKERFKTFLFKEMRAISKDYYKNNSLTIKQDPFSINFFVEDKENFNKAYGKEVKDSSDKFGGFSSKEEKTHVNLINTAKINGNKRNPQNIANTFAHESEHAIHAKSDPFSSDKRYHSPDVSEENFEDNKNLINNDVKFFFLHNLENAKNEIFAFQKGKRSKEGVEKSLFFKINTPLFEERDKGILDEIRELNPYYDYNEELREKNYKWIEQNESLLEMEKEQLKDSIDFLQSEYDRVLKNMIDVVYSGNESVEYLRNLPINEWYKASNGKYSRTDFTIKEFKF